MYGSKTRSHFAWEVFLCPRCGYEKFALEIGAPEEMVPWYRDAKRRRQEIPRQQWREDEVLRKIYREMQNIVRLRREKRTLGSVDGYEEKESDSVSGDTRRRRL